MVEDTRGDGASLRLVAVEELLRGAVEDGGEFPTEVVGILDARVEALAAGRRVYVRGVTGQEDSSDAIPVSQA